MRERLRRGGRCSRAAGLVRALVLSQAPSFEGGIAWKHGRDPKGILGRPAVGQLAMHLLKTKRAPAWFDVAMGDSPERAGVQRVAEEALTRGARWSLASAFQRFLVDGTRPAKVTQPVVALWGTPDRSHARTRRERSLELGSDVRLVEWNDAWHFPDLEAPARFADLARRLR